MEIDRDAARDAAQGELGKPIYPRASLTERLADWLDELIYKLMAEGASAPGGWLTILVLLGLLTAAVVVAIRVARRTMRTNRGGRTPSFGTQEMSAAQHRTTAEQAAASGDWAPAIRHRVRAVARHLEETGALNPVPGRTATELARDAGAVLSGLTAELRRAADTFNDVTYGQRPGTEPGYRLVVALDEHVLHPSPGSNRPGRPDHRRDRVGRRPMTAVGPTIGQRWRTLRWVALGIIAIVAVSAVGTYLTAPRPGGRMDPTATSPDGALALVSLLRDRGVDVVEAEDVEDVERAARPDSLVLVAQTFHVLGEQALQRLAAVPGDRLLVEPVSRTREALAVGIDVAPPPGLGGEPNCDLRAATLAGRVQFGLSDAYDVDDGTTATRCYDGALIRYTRDGRTITVVGSADFMTNSGLVTEGNAALAMNLAGARPRLIWFAPQRVEGESDEAASIMDLIPGRVGWIVFQLGLAVLFVALWRGRRVLGPLVAEQLPVVVRASETVEGRGRLYRSRRARDRAGAALRTATLRRLLPRLGLDNRTVPTAVAETVAQRVTHDPTVVDYALFGPAPTNDDELVHLAHLLDDIERQVATS